MMNREKHKRAILASIKREASKIRPPYTRKPRKARNRPRYYLMGG